MRPLKISKMKLKDIESIMANNKIFFRTPRSGKIYGMTLAQEVERYLDMTRTKHFIPINEGKRINGLEELSKELQKMSFEEFKQHVNNEKNNIADWIEHNLQNSQLATLVRTTKSKTRMSALIERQIKQWTKPTVRKSQVVQKPIVQTDQKTQLKLNKKHEVIRSNKKTRLSLHTGKPEVYIHEVNKQAHSQLLLISHIIFGIVVGVAIAVLMIGVR
jgi:hypothetical protein